MNDHTVCQRRSTLHPLLRPEQAYSDWARLYGSSKSLALSTLLHPCADGGVPPLQAPLLVLAAEGSGVERLLDELVFYLRGTEVPVWLLPDWETLPYDVFSPYRDIVSQRLKTLSELPALSSGVVVTSVSAAMSRLIPRQHLARHSLRLQCGKHIVMQDFCQRMLDCGYRMVKQVMEHGDIAQRGSLLDLFPMGSEVPFRIDLLDEEIDSIRSFDSETQRTLAKHALVEILPACEIDLTEAGIAHFRASWRDQFPGNPQDCSIYREVSKGLAPPGIEYYLPLFYQHTSTLFDYLPENAVVVMEQDTRAGCAGHWSGIEARYEQGRDNRERPLLSPDSLFLNEAELHEQAHRFHQVRLRELGDAHKHTIEYASTIPPKLPINVRAPEPLLALREFLDTCSARVLIVAESIGRREILLELFSGGLPRPTLVSDWRDFLQRRPEFAICVGKLEQGLRIDDPELVVICEAQLFDQQLMQRRLRKRRRHDAESVVRDLTELAPGMPVVHVDYGVGRYRGLVRRELDDVETEFILLEYAEGDKLYVPVMALNLIGRYTGADAEHAPLHKLGSAQWEKARQKAAKKVHDVAAELLEINARRAARPGHCFTLDNDAYRSFVQNFPFEETPDQHDAILAVLQDLQQPRPMDRLVCGDSGFGKTEIALRAAFVVVNNLKQVALLVPTTLLAQQHYQNFKERFADWPVKIAMLSRFCTPAEKKAALTGLRDGKVDIVIGTHRLLQRDVSFARLGMLIIDEEHRFGVRQKERFKAMRADVDVLTLTATPIPRTLNLALSSLREFSVITTPPSRRLAVKTFVREWDDTLIREALLREVKRGGQVFFLHNEVKSIERIARQVEALLPEARVRVAHGQMPERELESTMRDFYGRRFNVLVCTTIVETGIDIPTANTIIINRADRFGLAQLYQLRGRVGRSHHRAYAWLILPPHGSTSDDAKKRLEAIESLEELGIGFTLATHDLEIRGAGELLGDEQSGHIQALGFGMYMEMLENTVEALRAGRVPELDRPLDHGVEINLHTPALIRDDFLPDVQLRLSMYKRIANAKDQEQLNALQEEMIDRFGLLPEATHTLFHITALKLKTGPLGVQKIDMDATGGRVVFSEQPRVEPARIMQLIEAEPQHYRLDGPDRLRVTKSCPSCSDRLLALQGLFDKITPCPS